MKIDLVSVVVDPSLEKKGYHELSEEQLRLKDDPQALLEQGIRLRHAIGVRKNEDSGWELILSSAKLGHPVAFALCLFNGYGTEKNTLRAVELLRDSASRGDVVALSRLGDCHLHGLGMKENTQEAVRLYRLAVDRRYPPALFHLAWCFQHGQGVGRDDREAALLFRAAALQSVSFCQVLIGECYADGRGVEKNRLMAACFFRLATEFGIEHAQKTLDGSFARDNAQSEFFIVDAICNTNSTTTDLTKKRALQWLLSQRQDEASMFLSRHKHTRELIATIWSLLPQPIAEEIEPHIAALNPPKSEKTSRMDCNLKAKRQRKEE